MRYLDLISSGKRAWPSFGVCDADVEQVLRRCGASPTPGPHAGDRYLAAACLAGSGRAIAAFTAGPLKRALGRTSPGLRADVGQMVCERMLTGPSPALAQYLGAASLETWLRRAVERVAADCARASCSRQAMACETALGSPEPWLVDALSRAPVQGVVHEVLAALGPDDRALLAMFYRHQLPHGAIGARLGLPRSTVAHRLMRLHQRLGLQLKRALGSRLALDAAEIDDALELLRGDWARPLEFRSR
ncbi:MAG: hypothetical protein IPJ65_26675 [Archangiaceae bacterium]|nr:hypothetical protein [Archangiaceae bacterium]